MITKNLISVNEVNVCEELTDQEIELLNNDPETGRAMNGETMTVIIYQQSDQIT